jgi:hypothetical protein
MPSLNDFSLVGTHEINLEIIDSIITSQYVLNVTVNNNPPYFTIDPIIPT